MANEYATRAELKAWVGIPAADTGDDTILDRSLTTASRWVDSYCRRRFWQDSAVQALYFGGSNYDVLPLVDDEGRQHEVSDTTGLLVASDDAGDGTYSTSWTIGTHFEVLPVNAATAWPEAKPYTALRAIGSYSWPRPHDGSVSRPVRVRVTAKFGWASVPAAVKEATLFQAAALFKGRLSPEGVATFGDFAIRLSMRPDPRVGLLLREYRQLPVGIA